MGSLTSRFASSSLAKAGARSRMESASVSARIEASVMCDATVSMSPYIEAVKGKTRDLLRELGQQYPLIRLGCGFYRDHDCSEPFNFFGGGEPTNGEFVGVGDLPRLQAFLDEAGHTEGNSTNVEALGAALFYASELPWRARHRVLVCVGDHASHGFADPYIPEFQGDHDSIDLCELGMTHERIIACLKAAEMRCYMVRCGANADAERQYRDIARQTGGRFIDFQDVNSAQDLMVVVQAALTDATGGDARKLIEGKQRTGELAAPTVHALLESFDDNSRGRSDA